MKSLCVINGRPSDTMFTEYTYDAVGRLSREKLRQNGYWRQVQYTYPVNSELIDMRVTTENGHNMDTTWVKHENGFVVWDSVRWFADGQLMYFTVREMKKEGDNIVTVRRHTFGATPMETSITHTRQVINKDFLKEGRQNENAWSYECQYLDKPYHAMFGKPNLRYLATFLGTYDHGRHIASSKRYYYGGSSQDTQYEYKFDSDGYQTEMAHGEIAGLGVFQTWFHYYTWNDTF